LNEEEFRKHQVDRDQKTLNGKVKRWKQIRPATYGQPLPKLMWEYVTTADDMFIDGHFLGVVLLSAAIMELLLADQLVARTQMTGDEIEHFGLEQMTILSHRLQILNDQEKGTIDELRKLRNALIHANAGRLGKMARRSYSDFYQGLETEFYLSPLSDEGGIRADAFKYLCFTRDLTLKFYGSQE